MAQWKQVLDGQKEAPICSKWSATDEIKLATLTSQPITLADTALGRHQQTIKKQVTNVITKMSWNEREELRKRLEKMDEMEEEEQSPVVSVMPNLDSVKSQSKHDEQPTKDDSEMNNNESIYEAMMQSDALGNNEYKKQLTSA